MKRALLHLKQPAWKRWLASPYFFKGVLLLFCFQALWIALSARYPMAFDENYHFGLIKLYAQQWTPFFSISPETTGAFGDITRDPSYLFHYLMSFPYRLISLVTSIEGVQIVLLRCVNIALFTSGIVLFAKLFDRLGTSPAIKNTVLFLFCLIPIVPFLAAQINYDNLLFCLLPLCFLVTLRVIQCIKNQHIDLSATVWFLSLLSLTSLVKYPFLPIAVALFISVIVSYFIIKRQLRLKMVRRLLVDSHKKPLWIKIIVSIVLIVSIGLFIERDVTNVISYGTPSPSCTDIQPLDYCLSYGPFERNYNYATEALDKGISGDKNIVIFTAKWFYGMMYRLYFAINYNYINFLAPAMLFITAFSLSIVGIITSLIFSREIIRQHWFWLVIMFTIGIYTAALFYTNYSESIKLGQLVAINGRYMVLFLPLLILFSAKAFQLALYRVKHHDKLALFITIGVFILSLQGGLTTFIIRSDADWYWDNTVVQAVNTTATRVITPLVIDPGITFGQP